MAGLDTTPLASTPLTADTVGLLEGLSTTRAIRRYTGDPIPDGTLRDILFAATRAPSGSNRQPFRFLVLRDSETARAAKRLLGDAARRAWGSKRAHDGYDRGSGATADSPKARMGASMEHYVANFEQAPVVVLALLQRYREPTPTEGGSLYPACQNLLLAARALGYGGVLTIFNALVDEELHALLDIPADVFIAATITLGKPAGRHGPVRRRPLNELVSEDTWQGTAAWAVDPPGTRFTSAGPPRDTQRSNPTTKDQ
ncbi:MAG TPA: nitroreductase family protein [Acidimicrobiia bacterium]|jgi:nitroreductase